MMAREKSSKPWEERWDAKEGADDAIFSMGKGAPMTPVEATSTSSAGSFISAAANAAIFSASTIPWSPV